MGEGFEDSVQGEPKRLGVLEELLGELFDLRGRLDVAFDDSRKARAVKRDHEAARLLVKLAKHRPAP